MKKNYVKISKVIYEIMHKNDCVILNMRPLI
jgi:hypothetical protein